MAGETTWTKDERELYAYIGRVVQQFRLARKWTQEDLASCLGVARTSVVNLESGNQRMPVHKLAHIARFLGVRVSALLPPEV